MARAKRNAFPAPHSFSHTPHSHRLTDLFQPPTARRPLSTQPAAPAPHCPANPNGPLHERPLHSTLLHANSKRRYAKLLQSKPFCFATGKYTLPRSSTAARSWTLAMRFVFLQGLAATDRREPLFGLAGDGEGMRRTCAPLPCLWAYFCFSSPFLSCRQTGVCLQSRANK